MCSKVFMIKSPLSLRRRVLLRRQLSRINSTFTRKVTLAPFPQDSSLGIRESAR
ncbi:hypothetical protein GCM10007096_05090 [Pullulanibacillus pueri]|uniref:Uncharacterized protein n=1 Tax=Pullulanibacillus pueri TaxID=1437324 RepID=A0A8J3EKF4_9BACL|nr:hypothetical protein GCM10007096_05090 [Pullulanibacillus pueri]